MKDIEYSFSPSELDYKAKKCPRCYSLSKHYKITPGDRPPPVFSTFDSVQKPIDENRCDFQFHNPYLIFFLQFQGIFQQSNLK